MKGFLQAVAAYYTKHNDEQDLGRYTFVFPNQRSQMFFSSSVKAARPGAQARYMTMAELMEKTAGLRRANANELIVWLYVAYCKVRRSRTDGGEPEDFDRFRYWGEMLLRDFDEADRYLVDRLQLFKNVRDFKEIQSSYLTPEQLEIISTYWGEDPYWGHLDSAPADENDFGQHPFWLRFGNENGRFPLLWQMLSDVYQEFHNILIEHRKCYPGMAFRIAAEKVRGGDLFYIGTDCTCVFIGFSDISPSELTVMRKLHMMRRAEFFWDYDPALMGPGGCDMAGRFVGNYVKQMPQPVDLTDTHPATHSVEIISCPTNAGQVPMALDRIRRHSAGTNAIVLPDEDLLLPVLTQIDSEEFPSVCVSMSYPQRLTDMASLFAAVVSLQLRVIKRSGGGMEFFRNDVMELLAHPLIAVRYADDVRTIIDYLADNNTYNMPSEGVPTGALAAIFRRVDSDAPMQDVATYVNGVLRFIADTLAEIPGRGLDRMVCAHLATQTTELTALAGAYPEVAMRRNTFFRMVESALFRRPVPLTSPSVGGLQILGVLETRSLDFDHVVMLSMSDRVFPGRRTMRSFVPVTLRRAFGMPTPDVTEAHTAYHFYRLLSASRHMTLIFDSRSGGLRSGDMSRFLYQLRFLGFKGVDVRYNAATFGSLNASRLQLPAAKNTGVIKTPAVMKRLERFRDPECLGSNALSASALNKYLRCPLSFYLEYVADLKIPDDYRDDIDEATLGSAFHAVAENVMTYLRDSGKNPITRKKLEEVTESDIMDREILRAINSEVKKIPRYIMDEDGKTRIPNPRITSQPLTEEDQVLAVLLREMWRTMTLCEPDQFEFIAAEYSTRRQWSPIPNVVKPFNFTMKIDRIDCVDGVLRLVDYKTGSDLTSFNSVEALLDPSKQDRHAIFQLMLYCCAYADLSGDHTTPIKPLIYKTSSFAKDGVQDISLDRKPLTSYHDIEDEFRTRLADKLKELFDPTVPFNRCKGSADKECRYCKFHSICGV